jgi:Xaa-Pro aminopeptidase
MVIDPRFIPRAGRINDPHCALTLSERDRRWALARDAMDKWGLDCLFVVGRGQNENGNCRWLDNGDFSERCVVFPRKGKPVIIWAMANWSRWYLENSWEGCDYLPHNGKPSLAGAQAIIDLGYAKGTIGIVGLGNTGLNPEGTIPWLTYETFKAELPEAKFEDASDILVPLRMIKSGEELAMIEKAAELSNVEIDALLRHARAGVRESDLAAEITYASLKAGNELGRDHWFIMCAGRTGYPVNRRATDRLIGHGEMIMTGHYTRFGGYWSHPHMAVALGPMDDEYKAMRDAVYEATQVALDLLKPGTLWSDLDRKIDEPVLAGGYYHEITQYHCVGLDGLEQPVSSMVGGKVPVERRPIKAKGHVNGVPVRRNRPFTTEGLAVQVGTAVALEVKAAKDDRIFLEFGPQVIVTDTGAKVLTPDALDVVVV